MPYYLQNVKWGVLYWNFLMKHSISRVYYESLMGLSDLFLLLVVRLHAFSFEHSCFQKLVHLNVVQMTTLHM